MKKHLAWYTEGLERATDCRATIFQARSADEEWEVFQTYWSSAPRWAIGGRVEEIGGRVDGVDADTLVDARS